MPKHEAHATVASFDSQYWHCGASDEMAAPQFGQFRLCAFIAFAAPEAPNQLNIRSELGEPKLSEMNEIGLSMNDIEAVRATGKGRPLLAQIFLKIAD